MYFYSFKTIVLVIMLPNFILIFSYVLLSISSRTKPEVLLSF